MSGEKGVVVSRIQSFAGRCCVKRCQAFYVSQIRSAIKLSAAELTIKQHQSVSGQRG